MGQREKGGGTGNGEVQSTTCPPAFLEEQQERGEQTELAFKGAHAHGDDTATSRMRIDYEVTVVVGPWVGQVSA